MYTIEIDEEVYNYLKQNAEPFKDTPNSVLRKMLDLRIYQTHTKDNELSTSLPLFSDSVPGALAQILETILLVKNQGLSRNEATHMVAKLRKISTQAVIDKYTRQLDKKAYQIDELLETSNIKEFKELLIDRFPHHKNTIDAIFNTLKT